MIVLCIETSCDETAAAILDDRCRIHANVVLSQLDEHLPYGGSARWPKPARCA